MSSDLAVSVKNVGKCYRIYDRPQDRLKESLGRGLRRLTGPVNKLTPLPFRDAYGHEFWALSEINLDIFKGETFGVVGLNGSGKSTLLQIIAGTLAPTTGDVAVFGRVAALLELGSGFNPEFTGRENVFLNGAILGLSREQIEQRFDSIAAFADIGQFIEQPVKTYSSGMVVRLAFAVMVHVDADVLIIDEALAVGDVIFSQKCMRFLRDFQSRGTVVFVSHDSGAVVNLCSRAMWLQHGKARLVDDAKTVAEAYLEAFYEQIQGRAEGQRRASRPRRVNGEYRDQRLEFINQSPARNDIEMFSFSLSAASFGKGGAQIIEVALLDQDGRQLSWAVGGENVVLLVRAVALTDISNPIIGFYVKDRLGQALFGDNTFLTYRGCHVSVSSSQSLEARFSFFMPILPVGDYSIAVAIAEGTQENHTQHHWIHDALQFRSHSSSVSTGLVGVPMRSIELNKIDSE